MTTEVMKQKIAEYFKTQPVLKAWLFGSYSRGEERPDSDVDTFRGRHVPKVQPLLSRRNVYGPEGHSESRS